MALGEGLPPWLNVGPTDYLHAVQAGGAAGLGIAEAQNRAREAAARTAEAQRAAAQAQWEFGERMRQAAEEHASRDVLEQQRLNQQGEYQKGMLGYHQGQLGELSAHHQAMEEISADRAAKALEGGNAEIVEHPEAPGLQFLRNPSGAESVITRPEKELTPSQKATFALKAFNSFKPLSADLNVEGPMYSARTNYAGGLLRDIGAIPKPQYGASAWQGMNIPELGQPAAPTPDQGALLNQDWMSKPASEPNQERSIRRVHVQDSKGKDWTIPEWQVDLAKQQGFKVVE